MSRPLMPLPTIVKISAVRLMTQLSDKRSSNREAMANPRPSRRALSRWSAGRRPTRIEMKMMLSMPRTISRAVSIAKAIQMFGSSRNSMAGRRSANPKGKRGTGSRKVNF